MLGVDAQVIKYRDMAEATKLGYLREVRCNIALVCSLQHATYRHINVQHTNLRQAPYVQLMISCDYPRAQTPGLANICAGTFRTSATPRAWQVGATHMRVLDGVATLPQLCGMLGRLCTHSTAATA
jgi:hypothetical protein